jgi:hypothetical protein
MDGVSSAVKCNDGEASMSMAVTLRPDNTTPVCRRRNTCFDMAVRQYGACVRHRRGWAVADANNDVRAWASSYSLRCKLLMRTPIISRKKKAHLSSGRAIHGMYEGGPIPMAA